MINLKLDKRLFGGTTISFSTRLDDPKNDDLKVDSRLHWEQEEYIVTEAESETLEDGTEFHNVIADINWMALADHKKPGVQLIDAKTAREGMIQILQGEEWEVEGIVVGSDTFSLELTDASVLSWIWEWCKVTGTEPKFHTIRKTISIVTQIGVNRATRFEYGRNLRQFTKTEIPPKFTRLYAFGRDNLNLVSETGSSYIEDYSWYTAQGVSLEDARRLHRKDEIIADDTIVDTAVLYDMAAKVLESGSQGTITYKTLVADLSFFSGQPELAMEVGDSAIVVDRLTNQELPVRVSRYVEFPRDPAMNTIELAFGQIMLPTTQGTSRRSNSTRSWELFVSRNVDTPRQVRLGSTILNRIALDITDNAEWVLGFSISAVGVGSTTMTIEFTDDETDEVLWTTEVQAVTNGEKYDFAFTTASQDIVKGKRVLVARAYSSDAGLGIDIPAGSTTLWVLARGANRQNVTLPNSQRFDFTGAVQTFTVPDDVNEVQLDVNGAEGGTARAGGGARVVAKVPVVAGATYDVYVGGGSWPNGGASGSAGAFVRGGGGGGSSDFRPQGSTMASTLLCAGGGGGGGENSFSDPNPQGGGGGFYEGLPGLTNANAERATPGTQLAGGSGDSGGDGSFDLGGDGQDSGNSFDFCSGGGGGGYYGGEGGVFGPGGNNQSGGAGGSGWASPTAYDLEYTNGANQGEGYVIVSWELPEEIL